MPRKHKPKYLHPAFVSASSRHGSSQSKIDSPTPAGVNDILSRLRHSQARAIDPGNVAEAVSNLTLRSASLNTSIWNPNVQQEAHLSPRQRMMARARTRRLPGPAAPPSWSSTARSKRIILQQVTAATAAGKKMDRLPDLSLPPSGSLRDLAMKKMSMEFTQVVEDAGEYLSYLPSHIKQAFLAYLSVYGPPLVSIEEVETLFLDNDKLSGATGVDTITHFIAGPVMKPVANHTHAYKDLAVMLVGKDYVQAKKTTKLTEGSINEDHVPESWDNVAEATTVIVPQVSKAPRFTALTYLSLAHAPYASWRALLKNLTVHLGQLTHLSLAYWPMPSLTPNARTASLRGPTGDVSYAASDFYAAMDGNWGEVAMIVQQLGKDLIRLKWLDLEGCAAWVDALIYHGSHEISWAGTFRGLETLIISQGSVPEPLLEASAHDFVSNYAMWALVTLGNDAQRNPDFARLRFPLRHRSILEYQQEHDKHVDLSQVLEMHRWLSEEKHINTVAEDINATRRAKGVPQGVNVVSSKYPDWVEGMVHHPLRRGVARDAINYTMLTEVLTADMLLECKVSLEFIMFSESLPESITHSFETD